MKTKFYYWQRRYARNDYVINLLKVSTSMATKSFCEKYIKLWNSLDQSIQQSSTLSKFKFSMKRLYFTNISTF